MTSAVGSGADASGPRPLRIAINGADGRMGRALCALLVDDRNFAFVHAVVAPDAARAGAAVLPGAAMPRFSAGWEDAPALDVVVDFSSPAGLRAALAHCLRTGTALVTGTTGCDADLLAERDAAASDIAVLSAANFSLGMAVLGRVLREAAAMLPAWDAEIIEAHHAGKRDAPSGTALALGHAIAAGRGIHADRACARIDRAGVRTAGSIGYAVVRGGDIVGEHTAMLIGQGERLELVHRATDRTVFARGALHAARWLHGRVAGRYSLDDALAMPAATGA